MAFFTHAVFSFIRYLYCIYTLHTQVVDFESVDEVTALIFDGLIAKLNPSCWEDKASVDYTGLDDDLKEFSETMRVKMGWRFFTVLRKPFPDVPVPDPTEASVHRANAAIQSMFMDSFNEKYMWVQHGSKVVIMQLDHRIYRAQCADQASHMPMQVCV